MKNDLLLVIGGPNVLYVTTEKGELVLEHMNEIARLMPNSGSQDGA